MNIRQFWYIHGAALKTILISLVLDVLAGVWFGAVEHIPVWHGIYDELANAVTMGGDVQPQYPMGYIVNIFVCLTVIPLFGASISLFTTNLIGQHVQRSEDRIKKNSEDLHNDTRSHVSNEVSNSGN